MIKYWRLLILLVCVIGSLLAVGMRYYPYGRNGVEIVYVSDSSPARDVLRQGMQITELNGQTVSNVDSWNKKISGLVGSVNINADGQTYIININNTIGIDVMDIERTNLDFGLDLRGGTRIILKPKGCVKTDVNTTDCRITRDVIDQIIATLQTRSNLYGLREIKFSAVGGGDDYYIQVEAAGIGRGVVENLLSTQGNFEAKVEKPVKIDGGKASLVLGKDTYTINVFNDSSIEINNSVLHPNQTFMLKDITLNYLNKTESTLNFLATVYGGRDIELVYTDPQKSGVAPRGGVYEFYFVVLVSATGAQRFADVTTGIPKHIDIYSGEEYLDSRIYLYLDNQLVSDLKIGGSLGGQVYTTPQIQGAGNDLNEALQEKLRLQTILRSGALPTSLETASVDVVSPTLGKGFLTSAIYAGLFAAVVIIIIVFFRYRRLRVALPLSFISLCEVLIILGIASTNDAIIWSVVLIVNMMIIITAWWKKQEVDAFAWIGALLIPLLGLAAWTIDLSAIGGIIAAIGTGVDHLIIITDETLRGKKEEADLTYTVRKKIKVAFFIIFGAAATTIIAMVPLMFLGVGLVRGFAITTVIGVLTGILITRPAYANIVEAVNK